MISKEMSHRHLRFKMIHRLSKSHLTSEVASLESNFYHLENVKNVIKAHICYLRRSIMSLNNAWIAPQHLKLCVMEVLRSIHNLAIGAVLHWVIILLNVEIKIPVLVEMEKRITWWELVQRVTRVFCALIVLSDTLELVVLINVLCALIKVTMLQNFSSLS